MSKAREGFLRVILTMVVALAIGALLIIGIGENPISAYGALLQGAFDGKIPSWNDLSRLYAPSSDLSHGVCHRREGRRFQRRR